MKAIRKRWLLLRLSLISVTSRKAARTAFFVCLALIAGSAILTHSICRTFFLTFLQKRKITDGFKEAQP